ncbi:MAG: glutaredoxin 3 [Alphaproteobacteria bacterium]|nr:glutaredoxin 3 [Alphaproteobacteria bacterium]
MADIVIYTTPVCPYCTHAKALLGRKGITVITEINVAESDALREEMMRKAGGRKTVPQIFINGTHVGGFDDLSALDQAGKLDAMIAT